MYVLSAFYAVTCEFPEYLRDAVAILGFGASTLFM